MKPTIAKKLILPMAGIVLMTAFMVSWGLSWTWGAHLQAEARGEVAAAQAEVREVLGLTHELLVSRMDTELQVVLAQARRLGPGSRGPLIAAGAGTAHDLRFGGVSQKRLVALLDPRILMTEGALSFFSLRGPDLVRLPNPRFLPAGAAPAGLPLEPGSPAALALGKGRPYWGPAGQAGGLQFACYEPLLNVKGTLIGAVGIECPVAGFSWLHRTVSRIRILEQGLLLMVGPDGQPVFPDGPLAPGALQELLRSGRVAGEPWGAQREAFPIMGITVLAAYPVQAVTRPNRLLRWGTQGVALLLVAAVTLSHYLVLRRNLLQPLGGVLEVLGMISDYKRYELRFAGESRGEIGDLTGSLNGMLDQLQARDTRLLEYQEHLEDLVAQRLDQLLEVKRLLTVTLDALPVELALLDSDGIIQVTNLRWADQGSRPGNPLLAGATVGADYLAICRAVDPARVDLRRIAGQFLEILAGRRDQVRLDYDLDGAGGRRWFTVLASRVRGPGADQFVLMHMDVSEQKQTELQLRQAQKLESIGQLAAGIAHEINTPIQFVGDNTAFLQEAFRDLLALMAPLEALLEAARTGPCPPERVLAAEQALARADLEFLQAEVPRAFAESADGIRRIATIVKAMKDFSHPGTSVKTPTDLNQAIETTVLVCRSEWKHVAALELDLDPGLARVPCLPDQVNQVLLNLIINAAQAVAEAHPGGPGGLGRIRISTRSLGAFAQIAVADDGPGIPEHLRTRIFDPFFTTKAVGKGTGQGLAIAHSVIVDRHGGAILLETAVGLGTTFFINLPFEPQPASVP